LSMSPPHSVAGCIWRATFKEFLVENFKKFGLPNEDTARKCSNEIDIYETVQLWSLSMNDLRHADLSKQTKKEFMRMIRTIQHDETFQALAQKRFGDYYKPPKGMKTEMGNTVHSGGKLEVLLEVGPPQHHPKHEPGSYEEEMAELEKELEMSVSAEKILLHHGFTNMVFTNKSGYEKITVAAALCNCMNLKTMKDIGEADITNVHTHFLDNKNRQHFQALSRMCRSLTENSIFSDDDYDDSDSDDDRRKPSFGSSRHTKGMKTEMPDDDRVEHSRHSHTIFVAGCRWYGETGDFFVNNYDKFGFYNKEQAESFCKDLFLNFDFFDYGTETLAEFKYEHLGYNGLTERQREKFMLTINDVKNDPTFKALVKERFGPHSHAHSDGKLEVLLGKLRALSVDHGDPTRRTVLIDLKGRKKVLLSKHPLLDSKVVDLLKTTCRDFNLSFERCSIDSIDLNGHPYKCSNDEKIEDLAMDNASNYPRFVIWT